MKFITSSHWFYESYNNFRNNEKFNSEVIPKFMSTSFVAKLKLFENLRVCVIIWIKILPAFFNLCEYVCMYVWVLLQSQY